MLSLEKAHLRQEDTKINYQIPFFLHNGILLEAYIAKSLLASKPYCENSYRLEKSPRGPNIILNGPQEEGRSILSLTMKILSIFSFVQGEDMFLFMDCKIILYGYHGQSYDNSQDC